MEVTIRNVDSSSVAMHIEVHGEQGDAQWLVVHKYVKLPDARYRGNAQFKVVVEHMRR